MGSMKGPGIFLAQFLRDDPPYDNLKNIGGWVASLGYKGVQIPTWDARVIDLDTAAESRTYCDEYRGQLSELGLEPTELGGYLAGQVLAVHPAYELMFESFHPSGLRGEARTEWAAEQLRKCILASVNMGTTCIPVLSGGFAWQMVYPWPQRPQGIIDEAFTELSRRIDVHLDLASDGGGVDLPAGGAECDGADQVLGEHLRVCAQRDVDRLVNVALCPRSICFVLYERLDTIAYLSQG